MNKNSKQYIYINNLFKNICGAKKSHAIDHYYSNPLIHNLLVIHVR